MATKRAGVPCYDKADPDEPLFVLRSTDRLAPQIVRAWAFLAMLCGVGDKVDAARQCADQMERWGNEHGAGIPD